MVVLADRIHRASSALVLPEFQAHDVKWIPTTNASQTLVKIMGSVETEWANLSVFVQQPGMANSASLTIPASPVALAAKRLGRMAYRTTYSARRFNAPVNGAMRSQAMAYVTRTAIH